MFLIIMPASAFSQMRMAKNFSDHMVLQRDQPVHIRGLAMPGERIEVSFAGHSKNTLTLADSSWHIVLPSQKANASPQTLTVSGSQQTLTLKNILVGDVWLCIGQSNMEWPMQKEKHFRDESSGPLPLHVRFFNPMYAGKNIYGTSFSDSVAALLTPEKFYLPASWQVCNASSLPAMSAVAYYYGKEINAKTGVPVGLIQLAIGGAPLETFIDPEALFAHDTFKKKVQGDWLLNTELPVWARERALQNIGNNAHILSDSRGKNHAFKPGFAFNAGIKSILPSGIKGLISYQGESNAQEAARVDEYAALSALMISDYRKKAGNPLPYYFVQLSSIDSLNYNSRLWPAFRDNQRKSMEIIRHSGMAVTSDIGHPTDVHPANKRDVGIRLAKWALHKTYQIRVNPSGPLPRKAVYKNKMVKVYFHYAAKGLKTVNDAAVSGFSIDGLQLVNAKIKGKKILLQTSEAPTFVYYGWQPFSIGNLQNGEGLPASTFKLAVK